MTEKELKKLSRLELVEIIVAQKKQELALREQLEKAEQQLADRTVKASQAGSIAQASLELNGVFEAAQAAADTYLQSICALREEAEKRKAETEEECERMLEEARSKAAGMLRQAEERCAAAADDAQEQPREEEESAPSDRE